NTSHLREVAYGKKSYQSSTFVDNGTPYSSNLAVDGNMDTFMHTHSDNYPHWEVDLGKNYQIKRVEIYTRRNCCGERTHDLDISVGPSQNKMALCYHYVGPAKTGAHLIFDCQRTINGRYVNLTIKEKKCLI
ncbi:fucolectin-like, partial [Mytilus edulis]|uniref:fucolectin-like n=1 Tax=Mytilus edulis TaxID=6550 RepID=UPI0039EE6DA5